MGTTSMADRDGSLLFRELLRHFGGACVDEYYRAGVWDMETLGLDVELVRAHTRFGPPPKALEDIPEVVLPDPKDQLPLPPVTDPKAAGRGTKRTLDEMHKGKGKAEKGGKKGKAEKGASKGGLTGKGSRLKGKGSQLKGKGIQLPGKGLQSADKGSPKGSQWPAKGLSKGQAQIITPEMQGKGMQKLLQWPGQGAQFVDKGSQKGALALGKGKGKVKGAQGPAFSKASAHAPAYSKARVIVGRFAKRAASGASHMSKEVKEQFLDADGLD